MSTVWTRILELADRGQVVLSDHGYDELAADGISVRELMAGIKEAAVVEDYPEYPKGPCVLVLCGDSDGRPLHAVWGISRHADSPAVLVTAYRPDPKRWEADFKTRKST